jgi:hypothetical protein
VTGAVPEAVELAKDEAGLPVIPEITEAAESSTESEGNE